MPQERFDLSKPPFTIDGKTLHPVVERIDKEKKKSGKRKIISFHCSLAVISQLTEHGLLVPRREVNLEEPQANTSEQAEPSQAKAKGNRS